MKQAMLFACVLLFGCSPTAKIAADANNIGERADRIVDLTDKIGNTSKEVESIRSATAIQLEARKIKGVVSDIHATLPGTTDRTPWWADLLKWLAIAASGAAAVWLLTASGILGAIRAALGWIPRRKVTEAQMMSDTLAQDRPETVRELVAMLRAQDPLLDKAMRQIKQDKS